MEWNRIESRQNAQVKLAASLAEKKARDQAGLFVAEGSTLLFDFCSRNLFPEKVYLSCQALSLKEEIEAHLEESSARCYLLSESAFEKVTTEKGSEGVVSVFSYRRLQQTLLLKQTKRLVALEHVQDPGNVGTIIRSAASFGFDAVLMTGCADAFGTKAIRASMGAVAHIPVLTFPDTKQMMDRLETWGVKSVAACLSSQAKTIDQTSLKEPVCILIGNEGKGLSPLAISRSEEQSIIPIQNMESLNAAAAATVFLWEVARRGGMHEG